MLKKISKAFLLLVGMCSLYANTSGVVTVNEAESLVKRGDAQVITKKELNQIKKNNIKVEIKKLDSQKVELMQQKKREVDYIEKQRASEIAKLNARYDQNRLKIEKKRNSEIASVEKMKKMKFTEIELIDKLDKIAMKAKNKKKEQMRLIVINNIQGLKNHIKEYKHINNVMMRLSLSDSIEMYLTAKKEKYNHGILIRIRDYALKVASSNKAIDFTAFESVLLNGSNYELEDVIKIFKEGGY